MNLSNNNNNNNDIEPPPEEEFIPQTSAKSKKKSKNLPNIEIEEADTLEPPTLKKRRKGRPKISDSPQKKIKTSKNSGFSQNPSFSLENIEKEGEPILRVSSPFNNIFKMALRNIFHPNWEKRHSSCLILKAFLKENYAFLGFVKEIEVHNNKESSKLEILTIIKQDLNQFYKNKEETEKKTNDILTRILVIVALDRFGDFLFEKVFYQK